MGRRIGRGYATALLPAGERRLTEKGAHARGKEPTPEDAVVRDRCWRCILVHQACSLHFGLDLIMELTRH
jgi:hypothetical protein